MKTKSSVKISNSDDIIAGDGILAFTVNRKILFNDRRYYLLPEMTYPNFTLSGRHIIFVRYNQDTNNPYVLEMGIWKMDDTGKHLHIVSPLHYDDIALSPDGRYLAYVHTYVEEDEQDDCRSAIGILDLHTMHHIELTPHNTEYSHPAWSPDGNKLVFSKFHDNTRSIFIMKKNGTGQHIMFQQPKSDECGHPSWAPDGKSIAYCEDTDTGCELKIFNLFSHQNKIIAKNIFWATPAWSPNEHYLAFASAGPKAGYAAILNLRTGRRLIVDKNDVVYSRFTWAVIHKSN